MTAVELPFLDMAKVLSFSSQVDVLLGRDFLKEVCVTHMLTVSPHSGEHPYQLPSPMDMYTWFSFLSKQGKVELETMHEVLPFVLVNHRSHSSHTIPLWKG